MEKQIYNYSFIIPHKNSPELLRRCLDSIPKRKDIQIIVVDDNSNPDTLKDSIFSTNKYPNIDFIYTKEGKGAGYARNVGLKQVKGKWVLFADADDFYINDFINVLDNIKDSKADVIYFNVYTYNNERYDDYVILNELLSNYNPKDSKTINNLKYGFWAPWNKMFSSSFIQKHHIEFDEIPVGNDAFFSLKAGEYSSSIEVITDKLYCYVYNPNGITEKKRDFERELHYLDINLKINRFLRKHNMFHKQAILIRPFIIRSIYNRFGFIKMMSYILYFIKKDSLFLNIYYYLIYKLHNSFA